MNNRSEVKVGTVEEWEKLERKAEVLDKVREYCRNRHTELLAGPISLEAVAVDDTVTDILYLIKEAEAE